MKHAKHGNASRRILCTMGLLLVLGLAAGGFQPAFADTAGVLTYTLSGSDAAITSCERTATSDQVTAAFAEIADKGYTMTSIGNGAFLMCSNLTSVTIPEGVTSIDAYAFQYCHGLTSVTIPGSVTNLGDGAFSLSGLTSVAIPGGVINLGSAFYSCYDLVSVTIPDSVTTIGDRAFEYCKVLTSVTIPDSVTTIGDRAFSGSGLTSVTIPRNVTSIGNRTFQGCIALAAITVDPANNDYANDEYGVLFDKSMTRIIQYPAGGGLAYTIPAGVTVIGDNAFYGCVGLTSITIPKGVTTIGDSAFCESGLTSIVIPEGVTTIGDSAFYECLALKSVTIPDTVTSIGDFAFRYNAIERIHIPPSVMATGTSSSPFDSMGRLNTIVFGSGRTNIPAHMLTVEGMMGSINVYIPSTVKSVDANAFSSSPPPYITICGLADSDIQKWAIDNKVPFKSVNSWIVKTAVTAHRLVPYQYIIETNTPGNEDLSFEVVGGALPAGLTLLPDGQFRGAPLETGVFTFDVAIRFTLLDEVMDLQEIKLRVEEPTDAMLAATNDYKVSDFVGDPAVPDTDADYILRGDRAAGGLADQIFEAADSPADIARNLSNYRYFVDFWLDGERLTRNAEYTARDGSTIVTVYAKTFQDLNNGPHTIAAEFLLPNDDPAKPDVSKVAAQKFTLELTGEKPPSIPNPPNRPSYPSGPSGDGVSAADTPAQTTSAAGGIQIATPGGSPPVQNSDGSLTLPAGGTATLQGDVTVEAPAGTTVDANGAVRFPADAGGTVRTPGGISIELPGGVSVENDGTIHIPMGGADATITYPDGSEISVPAGYRITITDPATPLASALRIAWDNPFGDVKESDWFYADVVYVCENGLMNGTSGVAFSPNAPMTRGMFVTTLHRAANSPAPAGGQDAFSDVPANAYYADAAAWAAESGLASGTGDGAFAPAADITRGDLATLIARYAAFADKEVPAVRSHTAFADETLTPDYARDAIQTLAAGGILNGKPNNLFDPNGNATRAEVAAVLHRFLEASF